MARGSWSSERINSAKKIVRFILGKQHMMIRKKVASVVFPSVVEQTLVMVVGVVSTIMVSHLGSVAISGVGMTNIFMNLLISMFAAISTGTTVLIARLIGEGNISDARRALKQSAQVGAALSFVLAVLFFTFANQIIGLVFGRADAEVIATSTLYIKIMMFSFPTVIVNVILNGSLRGSGDTKTPMKVAWLVNAINISAGIFLIFQYNIDGVSFGMGLGVMGAAIATGIARFVGCVITVSIIVFRNSPIRTNLFGRPGIDKTLFKRMFRIGIPSAMEQLLLQGGIFAMQVIISGLGIITIAVFQIVQSINSTIFSSVSGFGFAATALVGKSLGARKLRRAEAFGYENMFQAVALSSVLTIILFILAPFVVQIYSSDPEVIAVGITAVRVSCSFQIILALNMTQANALRAAGDVKYTLVTSILGVWAFRILFMLFIAIPLNMGAPGAFLAMAIDYFVRTILYTVRFRKGNWKYIRF